MATHSSILAWRIPMDRRAWWAAVWGHKESNSTQQLHPAQRCTRHPRCGTAPGTRVLLLQDTSPLAEHSCGEPSRKSWLYGDGPITGQVQGLEGDLWVGVRHSVSGLGEGLC